MRVFMRDIKKNHSDFRLKANILKIQVLHVHSHSDNKAKILKSWNFRYRMGILMMKQSLDLIMTIDFNCILTLRHSIFFMKVIDIL